MCGIALRLAPFVEASRLAPREVVRPTVFEPSRFYGAAVLHSVTVGVRLGVGAPHVRMGRYGVAAAHGTRGTHAAHAPSDSSHPHEAP